MATEVRPALRGVLHRYAAVAFATGFVVLLASAREAHVRPWLAVHGASVTAMLTVSAVYHSGRLSQAAERTFRRIDHSTILLAIAGSYTGVVGPALEGDSRAWLLAPPPPPSPRPMRSNLRFSFASTWR